MIPGTLGREQLHSTLAPFAAPEELDALAAGLAEAGWVVVSEADGGLTIIDAGRKERERLLQLQQVLRNRAFAGVGAEEYGALINVLQRVAQNLS